MRHAAKEAGPMRQEAMQGSANGQEAGSRGKETGGRAP